jgi:hypothetical protein
VLAAAVAVGGVATAWNWWGTHVTPHDAAPSAAPSPEPSPAVPLLDLALTLQPLGSDGGPAGPALVTSNDHVFREDEGVWLTLALNRPGYLYVVNEAPTADPTTGLPRYTALFPRPGAADRLEQGDSVRVPAQNWLRFVGAKGEERLWVVWSASRVEALDGVERFVNATRKGRVDDAHAVALRRFLESSPHPDAVTDAVAKTVSVRGSSDPLVYELNLRHE